MNTFVHCARQGVLRMPGRLVSLLIFLVTFVVGCGIDAGHEATGRASQQIVGPIVSTDSASYNQGDTVTVSWNGLPTNAKDWVAIAPAGSPDLTFTAWVYTNGLSTGSAPFANVPGGTYVARAFENDGYTKLAESTSFTVVGPAPAVSTNKAAYIQSESATVTWAGGSGSNRDWVSIAPQGSDVHVLTAWQYTGGALSGSLSIALADFADGDYVARFFHNDTYDLKAESTPFHVGGTAVTTDKLAYTDGESVTVSFTGFEGNATDWVAIAREGSTNTQYVAWQYTNGEVTGSRVFAGLPSGRYVARGYFNNGFTIADESPVFQIGTPAAPSVTTDKASYSSAENVVASISGGPGNAKDWIALAAVGSPLTSFISWQYVGPATGGDFPVSLAGVAGGSYEIRFFVDDSYTLLAKSAAFTVSATPTSVSSASATYAFDQNVTVNFSGMSGSQYDWISIAVSGSDNTSFVSWKYTGGALSGQLVFDPLPPGTYVARAYFANTYNLEATSLEFTVTPPVE